MKKNKNIFSFFNCKELKNENERLKKQIDRLEKMISTFQAESRPNNSTITSELETIKNNVELQSKKLESIEEKIDQLSPDVDIPEQKVTFNIFSTIIAIVFICGIIIANIINIVNANILPSVIIFIAKLSETVICLELILHTGLLSKYDKNNTYFLGSRAIYILIIVVPIFIILYSPKISFEITIYCLSCVNTILSSIAFIVTFLGNLKNYTSRKK